MSASGDAVRKVADLAAERTKRDLAIEGTRELADMLAADAVETELDLNLITEPGVYDGIPAETYHRDPVLGGSLSSTGARILIRPGGPARFHHQKPKVKDAFDFGRAAHQLVLGDPEDNLVLINSDEWRTNAVKDQVEAARKAGKTPIRPRDFARVKAMALAIREHPLADRLLDPSDGKPEQTLVWQDEETGVMCRARIDWLRTIRPGRRLILSDFKTVSGEADIESFGKAAANYGYFIQEAMYLAGTIALALDPDPAFLFLVQETEYPYLTNVIELDPTALNIGRNLYRTALRAYAEYTRTAEWPGFGDQVQTASLPIWFTKLYDEE